MKRILSWLLFVFPLGASAQKLQDGITDIIYIGQQKNSYIEIAGDDVETVDIGAVEGKILYEQLPNTNIIKLKAAEANFKETNMLVVGVDTVLQFLLRFDTNPAKTLYKYSVSIPNKRKSPNRQSSITDTLDAGSTPIETKIDFSRAKNLRPNMYNVDMASGVKGTLLNIAQDGHKMYFAIRVDNMSKIDYHIDAANFEIRTRSRNLRKTAGQSNMPSFNEAPDNPQIIKIGEEARLYYAIDIFPLRPDETLFITIFEKNEVSKGRQLNIKVYNNDFNKIQVLK